MRCQTYVLVHQACLADTAVAKNDDLVSQSVFVLISCYACDIPTFNRIFLRDAILVVLVQRWLL